MPRRPATPPVNDVIDVTIHRIVGDGKGIGFADGKTLFVSRTAPGDRVRARVYAQQKNVMHATPAQFLAKSPMRISPACPYYDRCGGCDLMHIGYDDQLAVKQGMVVDALRRIARLPEIEEVPIVPSPEPWGYRSRAEWQVSVPAKLVGYFAERSKTIVDVAECPVSSMMLNALLGTLRDDVRNGLVPEAAKEYRAVATGTGSALENTGTQRSARLTWFIGEEDYHFTAECFFQTNIPVTEILLADVVAIAREARASTGIALDLYSGVGLFTLPLARLYGERVIAVESHEPAVACLRDNLKQAGLGRAKVIAQPVEHWIVQDHSRYGRVSLAVFDPPRTGAGAQAIEGMIRMKPAHVAAVSCDPATFSRDLRMLIDGGYELAAITAYDMFPQTHHVEVLAHLVRTDIVE